MGKRMTKAELEQRGHEYQVAWMQGYAAGFGDRSDEMMKFVELLHFCMDKNTIKRVQKYTQDLYAKRQIGRLTNEEWADLADILGEAIHNEWLRKRHEEKGWHHPKECPSSNPPCDNCHECMVPYDQVPDKDKELPRLYPKLFKKILEENGLRIVRIVGGGV